MFVVPGKNPHSIGAEQRLRFEIAADGHQPERVLPVGSVERVVTPPARRFGFRKPHAIQALFHRFNWFQNSSPIKVLPSTIVPSAAIRSASAQGISAGCKRSP